MGWKIKQFSDGYVAEYDYGQFDKKDTPHDVNRVS